MRGHVATFHASPLGADAVNPEVVSDGKVTEGPRSDGARSAGGWSDRSTCSGAQKGKKRAPKDSNPTVRRHRHDLQAQLVHSERQRAAGEARLEVLQRSKGFKPPESGPGANS